MMILVRSMLLLVLMLLPGASWSQTYYDSKGTIVQGHVIVGGDRSGPILTQSNPGWVLLGSGSATVGSNLTQIGGVAVSTGTGTTDAGTQRKVEATDSPLAPYSQVVVGSLTRPANNTAYTANTAWNNATSGANGVFTFTNACRINGGSVVIPEIDVYSNANPAIKLSGSLFLSAVIPGTIISDNAAFTIASADFANLRGPMQGIAFTLSNPQASGATNSVATLAGTTYHAACGDSSRNLYGIVQVTNTYGNGTTSPASGEVLTIKLHTIGVN